MANNAIFESVPVDKVRRSRFDLSHWNVTTTQIGKLTPILCKEVLPGEHIQLSTELFLRLQPTLAPFMHHVEAFVHHFYVPNHIITQGFSEQNVWQRFITGGQDGTDEPVLPHMTLANLAGANMFSTDAEYIAACGTSSIWAYMGLPALTEVGVAANSNFEGLVNTQKISLLPFAALGRIMLDYFMSESYQDGVFYDNPPILHEGLYDGNVAADNWFLHLYVFNTQPTYIRAYEKDYFTSCLPSAQRGNEVLIPVVASGSVTYLPITNVHQNVDNNDQDLNSEAVTGDLTTSPPSVTQSARIENIDEVIVSNTSVTINDFRTAVVTQQWLEANARAGYKYNDQIMMHFNVQIEDYRLNRAEYLGGGRSTVQIGEIPATATSDFGAEELPQGNLAGRATSYQQGNNRISYNCKEHGYIISILSLRPRTAYFQGLDRMWTRENKFDYPWHRFASLGEQAVKSNEVYWDVSVANNETVFGYQQRYGEVKYHKDRISGDMANTLGFWNLARRFDTDARGIQNSMDFINIDPAEQTRIFAVQTGDNVIVQARHNLSSIMPLPYYSVPGVNKV